MCFCEVFSFSAIWHSGCERNTVHSQRVGRLQALKCLKKKSQSRELLERGYAGPDTWPSVSSNF